MTIPPQRTTVNSSYLTLRCSSSCTQLELNLNIRYVISLLLSLPCLLAFLPLTLRESYINIYLCPSSVFCDLAGRKEASVLSRLFCSSTTVATGVDGLSVGKKGQTSTGHAQVTKW